MAENSGELVALATKEAFNDLARRAAVKGGETLSLIWKAGEVAQQAKDAVPHGGWVAFVEQHYDVNHSTVTRWMQFRANVPESKLCTVHNLAAGIKMLDPPKAKPKPKKPPKPPEPPQDAPETDTDEEPESEPETPATDAGAADEDFPEDETMEELCQRETSEIESWARQIGKLMTETQGALEDYPTLDELNARSGWERKLKEALATLRGTKPVPCPLCDGEQPKCACKGSGRVTKQQYKQMV